MFASLQCWVFLRDIYGWRIFMGMEMGDRLGLIETICGDGDGRPSRIDSV